MSQPGETDGYCLEEHVKAIDEHTQESVVDMVVIANDILYQDTLDRYHEKGSYPILVKEKEHDYQVVEKELLKFDDGLIRHDSSKVKKAFEEILKEE